MKTETDIHIKIMHFQMPMGMSNNSLFNSLLGLVSSHFGVEKKDILSNSRERKFFIPRCMVFALLFSINDSFGLTRAGLLMGGRDHSSVINARQSFFKDYDTNEKYKNVYRELRMKVQESLNIELPELPPRDLKKIEA